MSPGPCNFYITVAARDPATGFLDLTCSIARPQGQVVMTTESSDKESSIMKEVIQRHNEPLYGLYKGCLLDWPSEVAFKDTNRFYMMKKSELRYNDWIYMYLELEASCYDRGIEERSLSRLEIVQVAIETIEAVDARLNTKTAIVYIKYRDWARARIREPIDRKAIVRRVINEHSGYLTLLGETALGTEVRSKNILSYEQSLTDEQRYVVKELA